MEPASPPGDSLSVSALATTASAVGDEPVNEDISIAWVNEHPYLKKLEQGLPLSEFAVRSLNRNLQKEFKILSHMTQTTEHVNRLFKGEQQYIFNRYPEIIPFRHNMVALKGPDTSLNYINANFIKLPYAPQRIIATQGPMSNSVEQFWRMIEQNDINVIFMLCLLEEKTRVQCYRYWPEMSKLDGCLELTEHKIYPVSKTEIIHGLIERKFRLVSKNGNVDRQIVHYQWRNWGDHEAPREDSYDVVEELVRLAIENIKAGNKLVVHCSAGVGRTGTFLALVQLTMDMQHIQQQGQSSQEDHNISVFHVVRRLREQRWGMVFKCEQYVFLYMYLRRELS